MEVILVMSSRWTYTLCPPVKTDTTWVDCNFTFVLLQSNCHSFLRFVLEFRPTRPSFNASTSHFWPQRTTIPVSVQNQGKVIYWQLMWIRSVTPLLGCRCKDCNFSAFRADARYRNDLAFIFLEVNLMCIRSDKWDLLLCLDGTL